MTSAVSQAPARAASAASRSFRSAFTDARVAAIASLILLAVGVGIRAYFYADRRSLWLDEVWVSLNIVSRTFLSLAQPLDYAQSAPVGFLWAEHLAVVLGGVNEFALRAVPLLAGCVLLVALWMLARRLLDVPSAALCLGFAALSPLLVYYSHEVKPYISDALVTVGVIWLTLDVLGAPESTRAWRRLAIGGLVAILVSTPSVFVLAGAGIALLAHPAVFRSRAGWVRLASTGVLWVVAFVIGYVALYRSTANSDYMQRIWKDAFLAMPVRVLVGDVYDTARAPWNEALFAEDEALLPRKSITLVALFSAVGLASLWHRYGGSVALLFVVPFIAVGVASLAQLWPMVPRLLVFVVPLVVLLPVAGLYAITSLLPRRVGGLVVALVGLLSLIPAASFNVSSIETPRRRDDVAPLIREFSTLRTDDPTLMYVVGHGAPSWLFYTAHWDQRTGPVFDYAMARANTTAHPSTRGCVEQERSLRTVFGGMGEGAFSEPALAAEAAWLAAQPERDVWMLNITYELEPARRLDKQLIAHGATRTLERSRNGAVVRRYRFASADTPRAMGQCDGETAR